MINQPVLGQDYAEDQELGLLLSDLLFMNLI